MDDEELFYNPFVITDPQRGSAQYPGVHELHLAELAARDALPDIDFSPMSDSEAHDGNLAEMPNLP